MENNFKNRITNRLEKAGYLLITRNSWMNETYMKGNITLRVTYDYDCRKDTFKCNMEFKRMRYEKNVEPIDELYELISNRLKTHKDSVTILIPKNSKMNKLLEGKFCRLIIKQNFDNFNMSINKHPETGVFIINIHK